MKIRLVGAEMFHAGGQTDMTKLIVAFCNFANAPKNAQVSLVLRLNYVHEQVLIIIILVSSTYY